MTAPRERDRTPFIGPHGLTSTDERANPRRRPGAEDPRGELNAAIDAITTKDAANQVQEVT